eukprot:1187089-Prorocentrum_minimum.AAC.2
MDDLPLDELLGLQGPLMPLIENALTVLACNAACLFFGLCMPFHVGRACLVVASAALKALDTDYPSIMLRLLPPLGLHDEDEDGYTNTTSWGGYATSDDAEALGFSHGMCAADEALMMPTCPKLQLLDIPSRKLGEYSTTTTEAGGANVGLALLVGYIVLLQLAALGLLLRFLIQCALDGGPRKVARTFWRRARPVVDLVRSATRKGLTCAKVRRRIASTFSSRLLYSSYYNMFHRGEKVGRTRPRVQ